MSEKAPWIELYGDWKRDLRDAKVGYNLTVRIARGVPALSKIGPDTQVPELTSVGACVDRAFRDTFEEHWGQVMWLKSLVIMPDHVHCCMWVNERLKQGIRQMLTKVLFFSQREA